jgi:DNA-binding transcriptional ArsR family regulator
MLGLLCKPHPNSPATLRKRDRTMKPNYSQKILKILSQNRAVSLSELEREVSEPTIKASLKAKNDTKKASTAFKRTMKGLTETGLVTRHFSGQNDYALLTAAGKKKFASIKLESNTEILPNWDGYWRMVLLDLPESRKAERESLRYLLKKAGFICLKNSVWISPFPFEHMFANIKTDLGLTTEMMIFTTNTLDPETEAEILKIFGK